MANTGPVGTKRSIGKCMLLYIVTLFIYGYVWTYKTLEEMKKHTGEGIGGVLGLVIQFVFSPINFFVIPSEVGKMYQGDGREAPVTGKTGLWILLPLIGAIVWFVIP